MSIKRVLMALLMVAVMPLVMTSCKKQVRYPNCTKDSDCRVDAAGNEMNGVCYMGKCEECVEDTDCPDLKRCVSNRCERTCDSDADCGFSQHCESGTCVNDCTSNDVCAEDEVCSLGRCISRELAAEQVAKSACESISRIHFDFDKDVIKPEYLNNVDQLAQCLTSNPQIIVTIEGHTDAQGVSEYNLALGQRRADSVKNFLVTQKGIAPNRIETVSFGEQKPLVDNNNPAAWSQNRRAEFNLSHQ